MNSWKASALEKLKSLKKVCRIKGEIPAVFNQQAIVCIGNALNYNADKQEAMAKLLEELLERLPEEK